MSRTEITGSPYRIPLYRFTAVAALLWSVMIAGILGWDMIVAREHAEQLARHEARVRFNKDLAFRNWVSSHGGVYVPVDAKTPPNPGLAQIPERDIATPSGKALTLMNPAYVMRQVMSDFSELYGGKGKLTSLKLMNPANAPDPWERTALLRFEQGEREIAEFTEIDGKPYLRQIGALMVERGCLKCHGNQGYRIGDVRGGIVISVAMQPYLDSMYRDIRRTAWPLGAIWLMGLGVIVLLSIQVRRRIDAQQHSEEALRKSRAEMAIAHADLTRFADVAAHHLMEPTRRLVSYTQLLGRALATHSEAQADPALREYMQYLDRDAVRLRSLVRDIQLYLVAGQPRGEVRQEDAGQALEKAKQPLAQALRQAHVTLDVGELPPAVIDRQRLVDLFSILIENALKHGRPESSGFEPKISLSGERIGRMSRYRICDNGPGIPLEYRERVFDIFETLRTAAGSGTGIGLLIARRIVESRGGRIWIEEAVGGGAACIFELPDGE